MKYKVTLNEKVYEVEVEAGSAMLVDEYETYAPAPAPVPAVVTAAAPAAPVAAAPAPAGATAAGEVVPSPLPGTVLQVKVSGGEQVKAGQVLMVIEAMKMENEIMSPKDGTVAQIVAAKGATVNTGDPLVVIG
jgi:biotin carboxyl carrier protein